ncbi:hypothetical protein [Streptomyces collinus]|uniref:hypothetical protein n=1 Tax=Streptomyces collinus TaxID=42684 RepID=UPI0029436317|nr:hypothetical protein [Streptomyces collinus]
MGMKSKIALSAVVGVVVIGVVSANAGGGGKDGGGTGTGGKGSAVHRGGQKAAKGPAGVKAAAKKKAAFGGDGDFRVGSDIRPGTYRTTGNRAGLCHWERAKDAEQSLDSIITNDNVTGTAVVTVRATDAYFKTTGCGDWKKKTG